MNLRDCVVVCVGLFAGTGSSGLFGKRVPSIIDTRNYCNRDRRRVYGSGLVLGSESSEQRFIRMRLKAVVDILRMMREWEFAGKIKEVISIVKGVTRIETTMVA